MKKSAFALPFALLLAFAGPAPAARAPGFTAEPISALVRALSIDSMQGRPSFGRGQDRTTDELVFSMRGLGVTPGGDLISGRDNDGEQRRAWTQAVPMVRYTLTAPRASLNLGGQERGLGLGAQIVLRSLIPVSSVNLASAPLVFAGYGIEDPSRGWDDFKGADLTGKVAVVLAGDPSNAAYDGVNVTWAGRWTTKIEAAARHGAAGVLIVHDAAGAGYGWKTLSDAFAQPQFDLLRDDAARAHPQIEGWLSGEAAAALFTGAGLDLAAQRTSASSRDFRPIPMTGASFSTNAGVSFSQVITYNIVGRIKGQTHPDQAVVVTSHWDGPGAVEAQGAAAVLELARAHGSQTPNARSIVFVITGGGQEGGLGGAYYAAHPTYPLAKTVAVVAVGPFDAAGPARDMTLYDNSGSDLSQRAQQALGGRRLTLDPDHLYRTDAAPFIRTGVPSITLGSGSDLVNGGVGAGLAWRAAYLRGSYRQPGDVWSREMNFEGLAQDLEPLYRLTRDLANQSDWPAPSPEFSTVRGLSAGDRR